MFVAQYIYRSLLISGFQCISDIACTIILHLAQFVLLGVYLNGDDKPPVMCPHQCVVWIPGKRAQLDGFSCAIYLLDDIIYDDPELLQANPALRDLKQVFQGAVPRPMIPYYSRDSQILQKHINATIADRVSAEEALKTAQSEVMELIKDYGVKYLLAGIALYDCLYHCLGFF